MKDNDYLILKRDIQSMNYQNNMLQDYLHRLDVREHGSEPDIYEWAGL